MSREISKNINRMLDAGQALAKRPLKTSIRSTKTMALHHALKFPLHAPINNYPIEEQNVKAGELSGALRVGSGGPGILGGLLVNGFMQDGRASRPLFKRI